MRIPVLLSLCLAAIFAARAAAQSPDALAITKTFSFQQTSATDFAEHIPSATVAVSFDGNFPATTTVTLTTAGTTFALVRGTADPLNTSTFAVTRLFANHAALNAALPDGPCILTVTGIGFSHTTTFTAAFPSSATPPRFTQFDALQNWPGGTLQIFWTPLPESGRFDAPTFLLQSANGAVLFGSAGSPPVPAPLAAGTSAVSVLQPASNPGDIFFGTLTYFRPLSSEASIGLARLSLREAVELRVPLKRNPPPPTAPALAEHPRTQTVAEGGVVFLSVAATGGNLTYLWRKEGVVLPGETRALLIIGSARRTDAGSYTVTASNEVGAATSAPATLTVIPNLTTPFFPTSPAPAAPPQIGAPFSLGAPAVSVSAVAYQWLRDGIPLPGATLATLGFPAFRYTDIGTYVLAATNSAGTTTTAPVVLVVAPSARLTNLSVLTTLAAPAETFTLGYVLGGAYTSGPKSLVIRAAGPSLAALNLPGILDDPRLELFAGTTRTAENDNWGGSPALAAALAAVGAFPYSSPTSKDAATLAIVPTRDNSVKISAASTSTSTPPLPPGAVAAPGRVLAEVYDATPVGAATATTPRLINLSVLKSLGSGLTVGFTLSGTGPTTVLIRAIGPALAAAPFNLSGVVADPQLALFNTASTKLVENDNWSASPTLAASLAIAFMNVGAFALPPNSRDAALVTTLPPGGYSVQVTGVANTTGTALVEVYEVP